MLFLKIGSETEQPAGEKLGWNGKDICGPLVAVIQAKYGLTGRPEADRGCDRPLMFSDICSRCFEFPHILIYKISPFSHVQAGILPSEDRFFQDRRYDTQIKSVLLVAVLPRLCLAELHEDLCGLAPE